MSFMNEEEIIEMINKLNQMLYSEDGNILEISASVEINLDNIINLFNKKKIKLVKLLYQMIIY